MPLTMCNLSVAKARLGKQHVILVSQLFRRNEATWGIIFNSAYYHNFEVYSLEALSFLNKPILSAYVVYHSKWQAFLLPAEPRRKSQSTGNAVSGKPFSS
jgi:hypothetical protein